MVELAGVDDANFFGGGDTRLIESRRIFRQGDIFADLGVRSVGVLSSQEREAAHVRIATRRAKLARVVGSGSRATQVQGNAGSLREGTHALRRREEGDQ